MMSLSLAHDRKLTIFGRSLVMLVSEVVVNVVLWVAAAILWHRAEGHLLNLAVLAWVSTLVVVLEWDLDLRVRWHEDFGTSARYMVYRSRLGLD